MSWRMIKGDCMSVLAGMDSSSVDHIICDPPYDAKTHAGMRTTGGDTVQLGFDELSTMAHVREMLRVARRWVLAFCALEQLGEYKLFSGDSYVRGGFWDKVNGMPQLTGDRPAQPGEAIAIMYASAGRKAWNGGGSPALWRVPRATEGNHPTEKPVALMSLLIRAFTDYGDTILDPFAGSGSTGVAAIRAGRNFIGVEMLDKYYDIAERRLAGTNEQREIAFPKPRKPKQAKLFGGSDGEEKGKEEGPSVGGVEEQGSVPGDLLGERGDEAYAHREGEEGNGGQPGAAFPELAGEEIPDRDREEGDETEDHTPGPEDEDAGEFDRGW